MSNGTWGPDRSADADVISLCRWRLSVWWTVAGSVRENRSVTLRTRRASLERIESSRAPGVLSDPVLRLLKNDQIPSDAFHLESGSDAASLHEHPGQVC